MQLENDPLEDAAVEGIEGSNGELQAQLPQHSSCRLGLVFFLFFFVFFVENRFLQHRFRIKWSKTKCYKF